VTVFTGGRRSDTVPGVFFKNTQTCLDYARELPLIIIMEVRAVGYVQPGRGWPVPKKSVRDWARSQRAAKGKTVYNKLASVASITGQPIS